MGYVSAMCHILFAVVLTLIGIQRLLQPRWVHD
jgi:hypothetical protein